MCKRCPAAFRHTKDRGFSRQGSFTAPFPMKKKAHLVDNMAVELYQVPLQIQTCILGILAMLTVNIKKQLRSGFAGIRIERVEDIYGGLPFGSPSPVQKVL